MSLITTSAVLLATSAAVLAVGLVPTPLAAQPAQAGAATEDTAIRPFRVNIPDEALTDLRRRIAATKWPKQETVTDPSQGVQLATMQALARYWATDYDWRKVEARLNALPQFMTNIDGLDIHFIHVRSPHPSALPVIITHGWPGSIIEQLKVIDPLTNPYDIHSYLDVAPMLALEGYRVIVPYLRGYGSTRFLSSETFRNGQPSALAVDVVALMDALKIEKATLAGFDWGARTANIVAALWPERCKAMVSVSGYLIGSREAGRMPLPPKAELEWWYQFYFATERGRVGYEGYRHDFAKLIWQLASPQWAFDDATFDRTAASFDNPDHVSIVIHNYRWRLGLAEGDPKHEDLEKRLAEFPVITVPTITMEGDANGAPHPDPAVYARKFSGQYEHRLITGGVGHNLPQEAPRAFAEAVIDVDRS